MNESSSEFLNFDTNEGVFGIYPDNFTQVLVNSNGSDNEPGPRYTHTFGVRIILLAGKHNHCRFLFESNQFWSISLQSFEDP